MHVVIITGSRSWADTAAIHCALENVLGWVGPFTLVEGGARGADTIARRWAAGRTVEVRTFPADWKTHGRAAGPIRNREMAKWAKAHDSDAVCYAFPLGESGGTRDMIDVCHKALIYVEVDER